MRCQNFWHGELDVSVIMRAFEDVKSAFFGCNTLVDTVLRRIFRFAFRTVKLRENPGFERQNWGFWGGFSLSLGGLEVGAHWG